MDEKTAKSIDKSLKNIAASLKDIAKNTALSEGTEKEDNSEIRVRGFREG